MAEIVRRMEELAAAKGSDVARKTAADAKKPSRTSEEKKAKEVPKDSGNATTSTKTSIEMGETSKKLVNIPHDTTDTTQRAAAIQWASEEMADTTRVTQSTIGKNSSTRQKSVKIPIVIGNSTFCTTLTTHHQGMPLQHDFLYNAHDAPLKQPSVQRSRRTTKTTFCRTLTTHHQGNLPLPHDLCTTRTMFHPNSWETL